MTAIPTVALAGLAEMSALDIPRLGAIPAEKLRPVQTLRGRLAEAILATPPLALATALRGDLGTLYQRIEALELRALPGGAVPLGPVDPADPAFWPALLARLLYEYPADCLAEPALLDHCPPPLLEPVAGALLGGLPLDADGTAAARRRRFYIDLVAWITRRVEGAPDHPESRALLRAFLDRANFIAHFRDEADLETLRRRGRLITDRVDPPLPLLRQARPRIRLGIVALDAEERTETRAMIPLFRNLDAARFDVHLFLLGDLQTAYARSVAGLAARCVPLAGVPAGEQAGYIRGFDLDLLVFANNLLGRAGAYPALATRRMARRQIATLTSPASTGLPGIYGFLTSTQAENTSDLGCIAERYTETPVLMDGLPICFDDPEGQPVPPAETDGIDRLLAGLPGRVVMLATAHAAKLTPALREAWIAILDQAPDAVLVLLPGNPGWQIRINPDSIRRWFHSAARAAGLDTSRIIVAGPFVARSAVTYLAARVDIVLDSFPYGGCASLIDPLRAGTPVIALAGQGQKAHQGAALLCALRLDDLVAADVPAYVAHSVRLAGDPAECRRWRAVIRARIAAAPFLDPADFARRVAGAYEALYRDILQDGQNARDPGMVRIDAIWDACFPAGWYPLEGRADNGFWRWSGEAATLRFFAAPAGPAVLDIAIRHVAAAEQLAGIRLNVGGVSVTPDILPPLLASERALLRFRLPAEGGDLALTLSVPERRVAGDPRGLGVAVSRAALRPAGGDIAIAADAPLLGRGWRVDPQDGRHSLHPGHPGQLYLDRVEPGTWLVTLEPAAELVLSVDDMPVPLHRRGGVLQGYHQRVQPGPASLILRSPSAWSGNISLSRVAL
ncbi:MAG: hypothetical protein KKB63_03105 [Alphaproteobacteria bacterium]|nr:hypothetical protein [Alphaproteobacteria bacterium]